MDGRMDVRTVAHGTKIPDDPVDMARGYMTMVMTALASRVLACTNLLACLLACSLACLLCYVVIARGRQVCITPADGGKE